MESPWGCTLCEWVHVQDNAYVGHSAFSSPFKLDLNSIERTDSTGAEKVKVTHMSLIGLQLKWYNQPLVQYPQLNQEGK